MASETPHVESLAMAAEAQSLAALQVEGAATAPAENQLAAETGSHLLLEAPVTAAATTAEVEAPSSSLAAVDAPAVDIAPPTAPIESHPTLPSPPSLAPSPAPAPVQPPHPQGYAPAYQPYPTPQASPVTPYAQPAPSLPPVPQLAPGVENMPKPTSTMPDLGAVTNVFKGADGTVDPDKVTKFVGVAGAVVVGLIVLGFLIKFVKEPSLGGFFAIVLAGMLSSLAFLVFIALSAHAKESREARTLASLPPSVQHVVAQMEAGAQAAFFNEYERRRKKSLVGYFALWFGVHYFYLRQAGMNIAYWAAFSFFGFGWLWYWVDLFRMRTLVRAANEQTAREALQTLHIGATFAQMPVVPPTMIQPVPPMPPVNPAPGPMQQDR